MDLNFKRCTVNDADALRALSMRTYYDTFIDANLGIRPMFCDLGQTIAEYLGTAELQNGTSFLKDIK